MDTIFDNNIFSFEGQLLSQFTHSELQEPTTLAVNNEGEIFVADNGAKSVFIFLNVSHWVLIFNYVVGKYVFVFQ